MDLAAEAGDVDRPCVGGRVGVDLEAPELAGGFAAERNYPAVVDRLGALSGGGVGGIYPSSPVCEAECRRSASAASSQGRSCVRLGRFHLVAQWMGRT